MRRLILITFSDPTDTWYSSQSREYIKYFLERIKSRFGVEEDVEIVIKYINLTPGTEPAHVLGNFFRDKNPEVIGVFVQAHKVLEINKKILFLAEILREKQHPIEIFYFENKKAFILQSVFQGKMEGEEL